MRGGRLLLVVMAMAFLVIACARSDGLTPLEPPKDASKETAIFAGGCFWPMTEKFESLTGVVEVIAGVTGGHTSAFTEDQFARGETGHVEAVRVTYDPAKISYRELVDDYWRMIDPTDDLGQFCDRGPIYAPGVFATTTQLPIAEASRRAAAEKLGVDRFRTPIRAAGPFYAAGLEHQGFARKNPDLYRRYATGCGRDVRLKQLWGQEAVVK